MKLPYQVTHDVLLALGIDPNAIPVDGVSETGYDIFVLDENGKRTFSDNQPIRERREWTSEIIGRAVSGVLRLEEPSARIKLEENSNA